MNERHEWSLPGNGVCLRCPAPITSGQIYVEVLQGITHETCPPVLRVVDSTPASDDDDQADVRG